MWLPLSCYYSPELIQVHFENGVKLGFPQDIRRVKGEYEFNTPSCIRQVIVKDRASPFCNTLVMQKCFDGVISHEKDIS